MRKPHQWNTGRHYDQHGQRIVAQVDGLEIRFSDLSRGINGRIPLGDFLLGRDLDKYEIRELVTVNYDHGNYSGGAVTLQWTEGESK